MAKAPPDDEPTPSPAQQQPVWSIVSLVAGVVLLFSRPSGGGSAEGELLGAMWVIVCAALALSGAVGIARSVSASMPNRYKRGKR